IDELGVPGQRKIKDAKVCVAGAGGLGGPVIPYLAAAGVGMLAVVDFAEVENHNVERQVMPREATNGQCKTASAAAFVAARDRQINFIPLRERIHADNAQVLMQDYDIVVGGSDNFTTRYIVNDACVALGKPLVYGSIFAFEGQLAVFNFNGGKNL